MGTQAAGGIAKLTGRQSAFLDSLLNPARRGSATYNLFKGARSAAASGGDGLGILDGVWRSLKGAADLGGDGAKLGGRTAAKIAAAPGVKTALRVAGPVIPLYDAYSVVRIARNPEEIKGKAAKAATLAESTLSGLGAGLLAGGVAGARVGAMGRTPQSLAAGTLGGLIIGGTAGGIGGFGVGLDAITREGLGMPPEPRRPRRRPRLAWLRSMDYLERRASRGTGAARKTARKDLSFMRELVERNSRKLGASLARPFTRPLADGIRRAGTLSRSNVAAIVTQFRRLGPQMRQVTASALRDQVRTMERHGRVARGTARALVATINSQWPKLEPASRRAVTHALTSMSARMASARRALHPKAVALAQTIREGMRGPFGGIVKDFGDAVGRVVSTAKSVAQSVGSSSGGGGGGGYGTTLAPNVAGPPVPKSYWKRKAADFHRRLTSPIPGLRKGGRIPALVSPGEEIVHGAYSWMVPGLRTGADNVLTMMPLGAAVLTDHGQSLVAGGMSLQAALAHQLPHFGSGSAGVGATLPDWATPPLQTPARRPPKVTDLIGRLRDTTATPRELEDAMRKLVRALDDTDRVTFGRLRSLSGRLRKQIAQLRKGGVEGEERQQVARLRAILAQVDAAFDKRMQRHARRAAGALSTADRRDTHRAQRRTIRGIADDSVRGLGLQARAHHREATRLSPHIRRLEQDSAEALARGRRGLARRLGGQARSLRQTQRQRLVDMVATRRDQQVARASRIATTTDLHLRTEGIDPNSRRGLAALLASNARQQTALGKVRGNEGAIKELRAAAAEMARAAAQLERYQPANTRLALAGLTRDLGDDIGALREIEALQAADLARAQREGNTEEIIRLAGELKSTRDSLDALTEEQARANEIAQQRADLDRQLAENQSRMLAVAESQPNVLLGAMVSALNGQIGGQIGLGFQTPGTAGRPGIY